VVLCRTTRARPCPSGARAAQPLPPQHTHSPAAQRFLSQILESVIKFRWGALPVEQREGIKNYVSNLIIKYATNEQLFRCAAARRGCGRGAAAAAAVMGQAAAAAAAGPA
jgi:hypothetical protein